MEYSEIKKVGLLGSHGWSAKEPKKKRHKILAKIIDKNKSKYNELILALNFQKNNGRKRSETIEAIKTDIHHLEKIYGHLFKPIQIKSIKKYEKKFGSKGELKCYEYLQQKNISFKFQKLVKRKRLDFLVKDKVVIEYHPMNLMYDQTLDRNEYFKKRKKDLAETKYRNYVLLHATSVEEFKKYIDTIDSYLNLIRAKHRIRELVYQKKIKNINDLRRFKNEICNEEKCKPPKDQDIINSLGPKWKDLFGNLKSTDF